MLKFPYENILEICVFFEDLCVPRLGTITYGNISTNYGNTGNVD